MKIYSHIFNRITYCTKFRRCNNNGILLHRTCTSPPIVLRTKALCKSYSSVFCAEHYCPTLYQNVKDYLNSHIALHSKVSLNARTRFLKRWESSCIFGSLHLYLPGLGFSKIVYFSILDKSCYICTILVLQYLKFPINPINRFYLSLVLFFLSSHFCHFVPVFHCIYHYLRLWIGEIACFHICHGSM